LAQIGARVHLTIKDNGRGFERNGTSSNKPGLGLVGMRARAESVGGELTIDSSDGVAIGLWAPLEVAKS
jgi:signal transduction histidine kinase